MRQRLKIIIVGADFADLQTAVSLGGITAEVCLIARHVHHTCVPLLFQVERSSALCFSPWIFRLGGLSSLFTKRPESVVSFFDLAQRLSLGRSHRSATIKDRQETQFIFAFQFISGDIQ